MQLYTWIYSLEQPASAEKIAALNKDLGHFLDQWKSHGVPVEGLIQLRYDRFVLIQSRPDQERPSGCSIDSLRRSVEQILQNQGLTWADNSGVFFRDPSGEIRLIHFLQLEKLISDGEITGETLVFDHSMGNGDDLSRWEVPLKETWMKRYLPQAV